MRMQTIGNETEKQGSDQYQDEADANTRHSSDIDMWP
jgi:hypothetical protein